MGVLNQVTMRADILLLGSCALIGYGYSFQIANFLSSFTGEQTQQRQLVAPYPDSPYPDSPHPVQLEERQDQIAERQSVAITSITTVAVVAVISFTVSVITNIMFSINATFPEPEKPEWEWCYDDPSCDEEAWKSQAELCAMGSETLQSI